MASLRAGTPRAEPKGSDPIACHPPRMNIYEAVALLFYVAVVASGCWWIAAHLLGRRESTKRQARGFTGFFGASLFLTLVVWAWLA